MFLQTANPSFASQVLYKLLNSLPDQDIWIDVTYFEQPWEGEITSCCLSFIRLKETRVSVPPEGRQWFAQHSSVSTQLLEHLEWHTQTAGCVTHVEDSVWKFCHMVDGSRLMWELMGFSSFLQRSSKSLRVTWNIFFGLLLYGASSLKVEHCQHMHNLLKCENVILRL